MCKGVSTGGSWSPQEQSLPRIVGSRSGPEVISKGPERGHSPATAGQLYSCGIYQQSGETISPALTALTRDLWHWALEDISLTAQHIPGVFNTVADRMERDRSDWMLAPQVFQKINSTLGPLEIDLFASRLTFQLPWFFSWRPDPQTAAVDAFQQDWRICQPLMVPGGTGIEQGGVWAGSDSSGSSGLEGSDMVSSPTQDAEGSPPSSLPSRGSDAERGTA